MLKKLSIVLAFLGKPDIILLDEPLNTLDQTAVAMFYTWIQEKYKNDGISFLLSSHQRLKLDENANVHELLVADQTVNMDVV